MFVCALHGVSPQVVRLAEMESEREPWKKMNVNVKSSFVRPKRSISPRAQPGKKSCCRDFAG